MARKEIIGLIVGGIIVAAIIATLVTNNFTEPMFTKSVRVDIIGTDPTKIIQ